MAADESARQRRAALGDQTGEFPGLVREAADVVFEGERSAELAADLVLGLDQVGGDVAGAAQLGELLRGRTRG